MENENGGPKPSGAQAGPVHPAASGTTGEGHPLGPLSLAVTAEEKAAITQFLAAPGPPGAEPGRARALTWAALKFVGLLLLAAGVGIGLGDGNEFDNVGCSVAQQPGGASRGAGPAGRPECEARAERCMNRVADGECRVSRRRCRLFGLQKEEGGVRNEEVMKVLAEIQRDVAAVARHDWELVKENDELRRLKAGGLFDFAVKIAPADFQIFAAIMALGNRKAAAESLQVPLRTLYDQVARWSAAGKNYQVLVRWMQWRKAVGRKIKLRLEDSVQSGQPSAEAENPQTIRDVMQTVSAAENRDYPSILLEIMGALKAQNARNWPDVREQLVEMIGEEVPQ